MKSMDTRFHGYGWLLALSTLGCGSGGFLISSSSTFPIDASASDGAATPVDGASSDAPVGDEGDGGAGIVDGAASVDGADGATPTDGAAAPEGSTCDPTQSPHDEPCVLSAAYGVFVSPGGADTNPGTPAAPKATIAAAIALAAADNRPHVYLCDGVYTEAIDLRDRVSLFGGVTCPGGDAGVSYFTGTFAQVLPGANQVPLTIDGVDASIAVEDLVLTAGNASGQDDAGNGLSSVAALVNASTVAFRRCTFLAGSGDRGSGGTTPSNYAGATAPGGTLNVGATGGTGGTITCADGTSSFGGNGGGALVPGATGGAVPLPVLTPGADGRGVTFPIHSCNEPAADPGANGAAASGPGVPASALGTLTASGWTPSAGGAAANGNPGQGGGGGAQLATVLPTLLTGGVGGGAGGCGGAGGTGGGGGGGSIALACVASDVDVSGCSFVSGAAGIGGGGGDGQQGQGGGSTEGDAGIACAGGTGGNGAGGGGAAGGAGGVSVCVLWSGVAPTGAISCVTGAAGASGQGGVGGAGGMSALGAAAGGASASAGPSGVVEAELQVP
jgi:hypothetical protein